jgi:hypothetical protein
MRMRDVGRFVCTLFITGTAFVTAASCGGSGSSTGNGYDGSLGDGSKFSFGDGGNKNSCKPGTCQTLGYTCGDNADGCGGTLHCGTCNMPDFCGGGGYSKCGPGVGADGGPISPCTKKTCADYAGMCGQQSDGCGGLTDKCGQDDAGLLCPIGQFCGGGGSGICGTGMTDAGDGGSCTPKTCTDYPAGTCGQQSDGCGNLTANCTTCVAPQYCGGGSDGGSGPSMCGGNTGFGPDGGPTTPTCMPKTCADFPTGTCGLQGDGCGGTVASCTTCTSPDFCGGGGASICGGGDGGSSSGGPDGGTCNPKTCSDYPTGTCGPQSDGCGGLTVNCGTCTAPAFCGGGGTPGVCGGNNHIAPDGSIISSCVPATCASKGYNCGKAGDGCGGVMGPCGGTCPAPQACGAGGQPNVCGSNLTCTGLCTKQVTCDGGGTTTLTGIVRAGLQESTSGTNWTNGATPDPVPGVLVYIPNGTVQPFDSNPSAPQVQCQTCGANVTGNPLVLTTTDYNGKFTLSNVPVSASSTDKIPIVIQLGHWRRQYSFAINTACAPNALPQDLNLPSKSSEGDIPLTAISTGSYDAIECVLLKMGVAEDEFTSLPTWQAETATGTTPKPGRVHVYTATAGGGGNANPGARLATSFGTQQDETVLMGTGAAGGPTNGSFMLYDQLLLPCWGGPATKNAAELYNLGYYGDHGGHFFVTHYSYSWLSGNNNSSLNGIATWDLMADTNTNPFPNGTNFTGNVSNTVPPTIPVTNPGMFVKWLNYVGALSNGNPTGAPPAAPTVNITAGRHDVDSVAGQSVNWINGVDPNGRVNGATANMQLEFTWDMPIPASADASTTGQCGHGIFTDFHVNSANQSNGATFPAECTADKGALTSQERVLEYMIWDLASCVGPPPTATCTPKTCSSFGSPAPCGQQGDGCGGLTPDCNPCPGGQVCGGCGTPGVCCTPESGTCTALTCSSYPNQCGQQSNGCGGLTAACTCAAGQSCVSGQCVTTTDGGSSCVPLTCAAYPNTCGVQSDGCGGLTQDCMPCPSGQTCGGCGVAGQCCTPPSSSCTPQACPSSIQCGPAGDGCGGVIASCGTCTAPQTCGGCGTPGMCCGNSGCQPLTCQGQSLSCGQAGDGCGNVLDCGTCPANQSCVAGMCVPSGGTCTPKTCQDQNINCGPAGDGCGNLIPSCGTCMPPATCGGGSSPGQCGSPIAM